MRDRFAPYGNVLLYGLVSWARAWSKLADRWLGTPAAITERAQQ